MESAILPRKGLRTRMRVFRFAVSDIQKLGRILRITNPPPDVQETIKQKTQEFARRGFRTLGEFSRFSHRISNRWARLIFPIQA